MNTGCRHHAEYFGEINMCLITFSVPSRQTAAWLPENGTAEKASTVYKGSSIFVMHYIQYILHQYHCATASRAHSIEKERLTVDQD